MWTCPGWVYGEARRAVGALVVLLVLASLVSSQTNVSSPAPTQDAATGATGSAVPAKALLSGDKSSGNLVAHIGCDKSVLYDASTTGSTQLVALVSGQVIYVCGFVIFSGATANVDLRYGTGTACATGPTKITPAFQLTAQTGASYGNGEGVVAQTAAGNALCINSSAAVAVQALVTYTQM